MRRPLAVALATLLPGLAPPASAQPVEYLPAEHWAYRDLLAIQDEGAVPTLNPSARPWSRIEIAKALRAAPRSPFGSDPRFHRLLRELARELHWLDEATPEAETPPLWKASEDSSELRLSVGVSGAASGVPWSATQITPGSGLFLQTKMYAWPNVYIGSEIGAQRTGVDRNIGDSLIKGEDFYLEVREAYVTTSLSRFEILLGLTRTRWGPGREGTLLLSDVADSYPTLRMRRAFGTILEFSTVSGVLVQSDRRYFAAHRITLRPSRHLALGFAEAARYDAESPELLYVLNVVPYTLVERFSMKHGDRTPEIDRRNNVMMSFDMLWRPRFGARLWVEVLADDITTESDDAPHRLAWQVGGALQRRAWSVPVELSLEVTKVFRYVYAVYYGRDFVFADRPLGFRTGPDSELLSLEVKADPTVDWSAILRADWRRSGSGSLGEFWDPASPEGVWSASVLTDTVESDVAVSAGLAWTPRDNVRLEASVGFVHRDSVGHVHGARSGDPSVAVSVWLRK